MREYLELKSHYDNLSLGVMAISPAWDTLAVLHVSHGMCGNKERFVPFMEYMAENGVACVAHDHRGHGSSVRTIDDLGYMYEGGHDALVEDIGLVFRWSKSRFPGVRSIMLGHSMGSLALMSYLRGSSFLPDGAVLCGIPGYSPFAPVAYCLSTLICRIGLGHMRPRIIRKITSDRYNHDFASEGEMAWTCSDSEMRKAFAEDPLHNFIFTFNGNRALMGLMTDAYAHEDITMRSYDMPVLILSGEDDSCAGGRGGLSKAACAIHEYGFRNVGIKTYPAMRHEILNEIGKERVWRDILDFIKLC